MTYLKKVEIARNDLGYDAWGRPKTINDFTLFNALWTYSVPNRMWVEYIDIGAGYIEQSQIDNIFVKSVNGHLSVSASAGSDVFLVSKRHPRYQANKGLLYSSAEILPTPTVTGTREWGLMNTESGLFFRLVGNGTTQILYFVVRTTVGGITTDTQTDITSDVTALIPTFDISKGHVYDIQAQWRGVGDIAVYVDLVKVKVIDFLGLLEDLSVNNPALHVGFGVHSVGATTIEIIAGCVDVSSEGGHRANKIYSSISTGTTLLSTTNAGVAILAVKLPISVDYNGNIIRYTRDMILTEMSTFCKDEAFRSVYVARLVNTPNLDGITWATASDSLWNYTTNTGGALDTAFQLDKASMQNIYSTRNEKDFSSSHSNPDPENADFYLTGGDIIVVELKSDGNSTGGCTLEFAEEL